MFYPLQGCFRHLKKIFNQLEVSFLGSCCWRSNSIFLPSKPVSFSGKHYTNMQHAM